MTDYLLDISNFYLLDINFIAIYQIYLMVFEKIKYHKWMEVKKRQILLKLFQEIFLKHALTKFLTSFLNISA